MFSDKLSSEQLVDMASLKGSASEVIQELLKLIANPSYKRSDREIDLVLPWLCKRSQLLQHQSKSKTVMQYF